MEGMNLMFHLASAGAAVALAWALLRALRQRDLLRKLATAVGGDERGGRPVEVQAPGAWLRQFASALGITIEVSVGYDLPPRRIRGWVLFEMFLGQTIILIRLSALEDGGGNEGGDLQVAITTARPCADDATRAALERAASAALGERVRVQLVTAPKSAAP
jgi:hypothetical protein